MKIGNHESVESASFYYLDLTARKLDGYRLRNLRLKTAHQISQMLSKLGK